MSTNRLPTVMFISLSGLIGIGLSLASAEETHSLSNADIVGNNLADPLSGLQEKLRIIAPVTGGQGLKVKVKNDVAYIATGNLPGWMTGPDAPKYNPKRAQNLEAKKVENTPPAKEEIFFIVQKISDNSDKVALITHTGIVQATDQGDFAVIANKRNLDSKCMWTMESHGNNKYAFKSWRNFYLSARDGGNDAVEASKDEAKDWELFELKPHMGGFALLTSGAFKQDGKRFWVQSNKR